MTRALSFILGIALVFVLCAPIAVRAQSAQRPLDPTPVYTIVTLLVGTQAPGTETGVTLVTSTGLSTLQAVEYVENITELQEKLRTSFRLEQVDAVASLAELLQPGREMLLEAPGGPLKLIVRADGITEQLAGEPVRAADGTVSFIMRPGKKSANYNVRLMSGSKAMFDRPQSVALGQRTVLAKQIEANGPFYFIVITVPQPGVKMGTSYSAETSSKATISGTVAPGGGAGGVMGGIVSKPAGSGAVSGGVSGGVTGGIVSKPGGSGAVTGGVSGGVPGGVSGGVTGGISSRASDYSITTRNTSDAPPLKPLKLLYSFQPLMPPEAKAAGLRGPVILTGVIKDDGSVQNVKVIKSVPGLDDIAVAAFKQWRYEPPEPGPDGKPRTVSVAVAFTFSQEPN